MLKCVYLNLKTSKQFLTSSLILFALLFSATPVSSQENIINKLSDQHVYVKETRVSIIPPKDAQLSNAFLGFQLNKGGGSITITSVPFAYADFAKTINKEKLKPSGFELLSTETYVINNMPAKLMLSKGSSNGFPLFQYQLLIGGEKETVIIGARYTQDKPELGTILKKSLLSVVYDANKDVNHRNVLPFKVSADGTRFKLAKTIPTGVVYSTDGKFPPASKLHSLIVITQISINDKFVDKKLFFIDHQKKLDTKIDQTVFLREVSIDGLNGYEAYYKGKSKTNASPQNNYLIFLYSPSNTVYQISGLTIDNTTKTLEEFKKIAYSFERF